MVREDRILLASLKVSFSSSFRRLKREKGITPAQLHKELGLPYSSLCHWDVGHCVPVITDLIILSRYFGVSLDRMLGLIEEGTKKG